MWTFCRRFLFNLKVKLSVLLLDIILFGGKRFGNRLSPKTLQSFLEGFQVEEVFVLWKWFWVYCTCSFLVSSCSQDVEKYLTVDGLQIGGNSFGLRRLFCGCCNKVTDLDFLLFGMIGIRLIIWYGLPLLITKLNGFSTIDMSFE